MQKNKVDPLDLKAYSAGIGAALVIALAVNNPDYQQTSLVPPVQVIQREQLVNKSEDEKAELVWKHYGHVIKRSARKYDISKELIFSTIMIESGGNTYAIRHEPSIGDASYGLGQLLYGTAVGIGFEGSPQDLYDPEVNIELIARYHARNKSVYGEARHRTSPKPSVSASRSFPRVVRINSSLSATGGSPTTQTSRSALLNWLALRIMEWQEVTVEGTFFVVSWWLVLAALAFGTLVGLLAGLYPAARAARLAPLDALRYE